VSLSLEKEEEADVSLFSASTADAEMLRELLRNIGRFEGGGRKCESVDCWGFALHIVTVSEVWGKLANN
jgi:hypothetical protein